MRQTRNPYERPCSTCGIRGTCPACEQTAGCQDCTRTARCGSCRNIFSKQARAAGRGSVVTAGRRASQARQPCGAVPRDGGATEAVDLPCCRSGLHGYYQLVATTTDDLRFSGGRWLFTASPALRIELVDARDQFETPAPVWRHAVDALRVDRDAHASALNAISSAYDSRASQGPQPGARYFLNPAYGGHCAAIGETLARYVWQDGCAVVAVLPALLHTGWWHEYVMKANSIHYLRHKLRFANPFMDSVVSSTRLSSWCGSRLEPAHRQTGSPSSSAALPTAATRRSCVCDAARAAASIACCRATRASRRSRSRALLWPIQASTRALPRTWCGSGRDAANFRGEMGAALRCMLQ